MGKISLEDVLKDLSPKVMIRARRFAAKAHAYSVFWVDEDDFFQVGNIAILKAYREFHDPDGSMQLFAGMAISMVIYRMSDLLSIVTGEKRLHRRVMLPIGPLGEDDYIDPADRNDDIQRIEQREIITHVCHLAKLSQVEENVLRRVIQNWEYSEIAATLKISVNDATNAWRRAKEKIKHILKCGKQFADIAEEDVPARSLGATVKERTGVSWVNLGAKWCSMITHEGRRVVLGYFKDRDEAVAVREQALADPQIIKNRIMELDNKRQSA